MKIRTLFIHFAEHKIRWCLFSVVVIVVIILGTYHNRADARLEPVCKALTEQLLKERFTQPIPRVERIQQIDETLKQLGVAWIAVNVSGSSIDWRNVRYPKFLFVKGELIRSSDPSYLVELTLHNAINEFGLENPPICVSNPSSILPSMRIYYEYPFWIAHREFFPWVAGILLLIFIAIFYLGVKNRDMIQQAHLWVNFAKETAHQLGTPLSSLYGWIEMLKLKLIEKAELDPAKVNYILQEAAEDVKKLMKRVHRFSQIGSTPELAQNDLNEVVREIIHYFRERLPSGEKSIQLVANYDEIPPMMLNKDLMGWVFENLLKNSMDAIQKKEGIIQVETLFLAKENLVRITHTDNGCGVKKENFKKIFNPGFSTKKHGWGLGLALARRIVTDYHGGKIFVESSQIDRGTSFVVELPVRKTK